MQTTPTHGNVVPHKPSLVDAFGRGVTQARPNEATYNGVFRTPWYFSPEMRQAWIEDHLKNYCVQQDPKVIVSMGNSREEAFAAQLAAMTPRQRHSIFFMPG